MRPVDHFPSIARRLAREHSSQYVRGRPFSTAKVQARVLVSSASCRPQKSHVVTSVAYDGTGTPART